MASKTFAVFDLDSTKNQDMEVLILSNLLEKKYNSVTVLDLNVGAHNSFLKDVAWKKVDQISQAKVFDLTSYQLWDNEALNANKIVNSISSLADKNEILIINPNYNKHKVNEEPLQNIDNLLVFVKVKNNITTHILNFLLAHTFKNKNIFIFVTGYDHNMQNQKEIVALKKQFKGSNFLIETINKIPNFKSLEDIESIDPWLEIYKKLQMIF